MRTRRAKLSDMAALVGLARSFQSESHWGWKFSQERSEENFYNYIQNEDTEVILLESEEISGFARVAYDYEDSEERIGYVSKFYISPNARGTAAGRKLLEACTAWFDYHGCKASFATSTANIGNNKAFVNLMAKYGYEACGDTLVRTYEQSQKSI